jgi:hypothetical protein
VDDKTQHVVLTHSRAASGETVGLPSRPRFGCDIWGASTVSNIQFVGSAAGGVIGWSNQPLALICPPDVVAVGPVSAYRRLTYRREVRSTQKRAEQLSIWGE